MSSSLPVVRQASYTARPRHLHGCRVIPDDALDTVTTSRQAGLRTIVYLSYSGLGRDMERGIRHEELKANFPRLAQAGVPVVHYCRPAFPESATTRAMESVFDWQRPTHAALWRPV